MQEPPDYDLSADIHQYVLNGCIDEYENLLAWEAALKENIKFPFEARCKYKKEIIGIEVLRFKFFKRTVEEGLKAVLQVQRKEDEVLMNLPLEKVLKSKADKNTNYYIQLWKYWKMDY